MYIKNTKENADRIAKEGDIERRSKVNPLQLKLREVIQSDDYTKINKYAEGMCYGCMKRDRILSSLYDVCAKCIARRGTEGIMAKTKTKVTEELCDFCGEWQGGAENDYFVSQLNVSLCNTCHCRVISLHKQYNRDGGREVLSPYFKHLIKEHGKDWKAVMSDGITRRSF